MSQRTERIDELLRQEIGDILSREVADPRVGFATVTEVETAPDLRHARVWISVIGQRGERDETIAALQRTTSRVARPTAGPRPGCRCQTPASADSSMTVDLAPLAGDVPEAVVERLRG